MFISRSLTNKALTNWLTKYVIWLLLFNGVISLLYFFKIINIALPWLPISVIGTAVAFFVGFKNNQAYDRMWEARKIWGGIVNESRTWAMLVDSYIRNTKGQTKKEINQIKRKLIHRHIAWLYIHRIQLLEPQPWEQQGAEGQTKKSAKKYENTLGLGSWDNDVTLADAKTFLEPDEFEILNKVQNKATQLINHQSRDIIQLHDKEYITQFQHNEMEEVLRTFYTLQGQNERIKKFPFPRDYSGMSHFFVWIFIVLFPFSLIPELLKLGDWAFWIGIPVATLIGLIYVIMEELGDYHENPFMRTPHAMPMLALCRTIEIDMREIIGETDLPPAITAKNSVLM